MTGVGFLSIDGSDIDDLIADLRQVERNLGAQQRKGNRVVGAKVAGWAQADARSGTPQQAHFADAIRFSATQDTARLRLVSTGRLDGADGTFWGSKQFEQFPDWVGNNWIAGSAGEGPYVLNDTISEHLPQIEDMYLDAYEQAFAAAIPKG